MINNRIIAAKFQEVHCLFNGVASKIKFDGVAMRVTLRQGLCLFGSDFWGNWRCFAFITTAADSRGSSRHCSGHLSEVSNLWWLVVWRKCMSGVLSQYLLTLLKCLFSEIVSWFSSLSFIVSGTIITTWHSRGFTFKTCSGFCVLFQCLRLRCMCRDKRLQIKINKKIQTLFYWFHEPYLILL